MGREFELKFQADSDKIHEIQKKFGDFQTISMKTVYYDTSRGSLAEGKWTLRLRRENGSTVVTLKTPLPDGSRGEWEALCPTIEAGISELCKLDVPKNFPLLLQEGVTETAGAEFLRLTKKLTLPDCTVELALDQGLLLGPGRTLPFAEVEVELKSGSETAATAFAQALSQEFSLTPQPKSKHQRALELLK